MKVDFISFYHTQFCVACERDLIFVPKHVARFEDGEVRYCQKCPLCHMYGVDLDRYQWQ